MTAVDEVKAATPQIVHEYSRKSNTKAVIQLLNTLPPYFLIFYLAVESMAVSYWLAAACIVLLSFFILRIFVLLHDCGHNSLFRTRSLNKIAGFFTGVLSGMPQYVWSQHHNFHHQTNGDWEQYRGPLSTLSVSEYERLTPAARKKYRYSRSILLAPLGAFMYFIFNPRFNWMRGSLQFAVAVISRKIKHPRESLKTIVETQESRAWKSGKEYLHMTMNNIALLSIWVGASWYFGAAEFFTVFVLSLSLAGAGAIIIFTVQHNFEGSYASDTAHCDYYRAALEGTSFLRLPAILNWFCADIAYHHIHHISAGIPNYNLAACHKQYGHLFKEVKRLKLGDIAKSFSNILWDEVNQRITSIDKSRLAGAISD